MNIKAPTAENGESHTLTEKMYWDGVWCEIELPREANYTNDCSLINAQLEVIDKHFPPDSDKTILEIGGAPGGYLARFVRRFGYKAFALDYSAVGCRKLRDNFALLNLNVVIYEADLTSDTIDLQRFDIVYSLGFIEHFRDLDSIVAKHAALVKPGGLLLLGVPHFILVYQSLLRRLNPETLAGHNLESLSLANWTRFEEKLGLSVVFKGYVGGLQPSIIRSFIKAGPRGGSPAAKLLDVVLRVYTKIISVVSRVLPIDKYLQNVNSHSFSSYAMAIYRVPSSSQLQAR